MAHYFSNCPNCGKLIMLKYPNTIECSCGTMVFNYYKIEDNCNHELSDEDI